MAFKIESIDKLQETAGRLDEYTSSANTETQKVTSSIDNLSSAISGQGVGDALKKIKELVETNTKSAIDALTYTSTFITSQAATYMNVEDETMTLLSEVDAALNNMELL